jgi:hypothetical protein
MLIIFNKEALKQVSALSIDLQYVARLEMEATQLGLKVFSFTGKSTPEYKELCTSLNQGYSDLIKQYADIEIQLKELQALIPTFAEEVNI